MAEEYQYQPYGLPLVKRHLAYGDSDADGDVDSTDNTAHFTALTTYNRKFDADFDGDVGNNVGDPDRDAWDNAYNDPGAGTTMVVANRGFSPTGNPFLFTGRRLQHYSISCSGFREAQGPAICGNPRGLKSAARYTKTQDCFRRRGGPLPLPLPHVSPGPEAVHPAGSAGVWSVGAGFVSGCLRAANGGVNLRARPMRASTTSC